MDAHTFGGGRVAEILVQEITKSNDKRLAAKVSCVLSEAFAYLKRIDEIPDYDTCEFCRARWLEHYTALLKRHLEQQDWPKPVCTFALNLLKIRWRQTL